MAPDNPMTTPGIIWRSDDLTTPIEGWRGTLEIRAGSAVDSTTGPLAELARLRADVEALKAENAVLSEQVRALWHALAKVLDAGNREAAATMSWQNARENFSDSSHERKAHERAMLAASDAEREAHVLLATLKRFGA